MIELPITDRKARRHSATRDEIVAAAWELARTDGLAGISMRDLAARVGMRSPSLYTYFPSKHAIYDAMFAQGHQAFLTRMRAFGELPRDPRLALRRVLLDWVDFCLEDPARFTLLYLRTIPGFEPSPESYAIAVEALDDVRAMLASLGVNGPKALDLWTALTSGLITQQIANDPGGDRWTRLVDDFVDMYLSYVKPREGGNRR